MKSQTLHIASAGLGINTVAYLIECKKQGIEFDKILFADPGKENPRTYEYIPILNKWLTDHNQPEITILYNVDASGKFIGLYQDCINNKALPSIVYGYKTCSLKYKKAPQDKFLNNWWISKHLWRLGGIVLKYIGYDADESHRTVKDFTNDKFANVYTLVDNNMGRFECIQVIIDTGLPLPPKSSCTFCPSMKPFEIIELYETYPNEFYDAIRMERNAELTNIKGLGRDWSWWDLILAYKYLKLVKKYGQMGKVPVRIKKLMRKVNRSTPIDFEKLSQKRNSPKEAVCSLFKQSIDVPCDCMN